MKSVLCATGYLQWCKTVTNRHNCVITGNANSRKQIDDAEQYTVIPRFSATLGKAKIRLSRPSPPPKKYFSILQWFLRHLLGITKLEKEKNQCIRQKNGSYELWRRIRCKTEWKMALETEEFPEYHPTVHQISSCPSCFLYWNLCCALTHTVNQQITIFLYLKHVSCEFLHPHRLTTTQRLPTSRS